MKVSRICIRRFLKKVLCRHACPQGIACKMQGPTGEEVSRVCVGLSCRIEETLIPYCSIQRAQDHIVLVLLIRQDEEYVNTLRVATCLDSSLVWILQLSFSAFCSSLCLLHVVRLSCLEFVKANRQNSMLCTDTHKAEKLLLVADSCRVHTEMHTTPGKTRG